MSLKNKPEWPLFVDYAIAIKDFIVNTTHLSYFPVDQNVQVFFAPITRAYAKIVVPFYNGSTLNPTITFNYASFEINTQGEVPNGYVTMMSEGSNGKWGEYRHPLPCKLIFKGTMFVVNQQDADILNYQLFTAAPKNRKFATKVNGQWCEIEVSNISNETSLEPADTENRAVRWGFDITIPRAYLPFEYAENFGTIENIEIGYDL